MNLEGKRVLVTGATGFIGSRVAERLHEAGAAVFAVSKRLGYDLTLEQDALSAFVLARPDLVIHLAASHSTRDEADALPYSCSRENLLMALNVLGGAARVDAPVLTVTTGDVYAPATERPAKELDLYPATLPNGPYAGIGRGILEILGAASAQYRLRSVQAILPDVYGAVPLGAPRGRWAIDTLQALALAQGGKDATIRVRGNPQDTISLVHVDDVAASLICMGSRLLEEPLDAVGPVNIANPNGIRRELFTTLAANALGYKGAVSWDGPKEPRNTALSAERFQQLAGASAWTTPENGVTKVAEWLRDQKTAPAQTS